GRRQPDDSGRGDRALDHNAKESTMTTTEILQQQTPATQRWTLDPNHTTVEFEVGHMWGLSSVSGRFGRFGAWYVVEAGHPSLGLGVDATSVDTGNSARDKHL